LPVDLHSHTTHSDGTFTPGELIRLAKSRELSAVAITDHDVTTGNNEAIAVGKETGVDVVPGVELSIEHPLASGGHIDILGLFIDHQQPALNSALDYLRQERRKRSEKILDRLSKAGIDLSMEDVRKTAGKGSTGRPHIARVLLEQGHVASIDEAFERYLKSGAPAFVDKEKLNTAAALDIIHQAGGLSILAHPFSLGFKTYRDLFAEILALQKLGLQGIEVYYTNYTKDMCRSLRRFALSNGLLISGGSDFHGRNKPHVQLGSGSGNLEVADKVYDDLYDFWQSGR